MKVSELLTDETKWCQGCHARDQRGHEVRWNSPDACCWCLLGALNLCYAHRKLKVAYSVVRHLRGVGVAEWNDASERTFEDVRQLIVEMDI